jgi:DNA-binding response OmpR family regulator
MAKKILLIEDERLLLEMYVSRLEKAGFEILSAEDGDMGLKIAQEKIPDLILLDIVMPGMSGYDVLKELKTNPSTKDIPVIVFSNLGQEEEIKKGLALGAEDYIVKTSVTPTELLEKIESKIIK